MNSETPAFAVLVLDIHPQLTGIEVADETEQRWIVIRFEDEDEDHPSAAGPP